MRFSHAVSAGVLLAICSCFPEANASSQPPVLVITPTRIAQPTSQVVAPTQVIDRQQIEASGAQTASGVLNFIPGFDVVQSGGSGQLTSVFLQGTNSNMVKVLINGVPVNDSTTGGAPWADIPTADIERIEIVEGPLSTLWGSSAIGGVINIITRQPGGLGGHLGAGWGGWDTHTGSLGLHASGHHAVVGATINGQHTAGTPVVSGMSEAAPYTNRTVTAYAALHKQGASLRADYWQSQGRGDYASGYPPYTPMTLLSQRYLHQTAALRMRLPIAGSWRIKGGVLQTRNAFYQDQPETFNPVAFDFAQSVRNAVSAQMVYASADMRFLAGGSHARTHAASLSYGTAYDGYRSVNAGYMEWQMSAGAGQLTTAVRRTENSQFGNHDTWNLGVGYHLSHDVLLDVSTGTGYRAPTFNDLYGFGGNPDLKPEISRSVQADLHAAFGNGAGWHLLIFQQHIDDLIETLLINPSTYSYLNRNVQQARIQGMTLGGSWNQGRFSLKLDATWQDPRNLNTGKPLLRRASQSYDARLLYDAGRWQLGNDWVYRGHREDFGGQSLAPYLLGNLVLRFHIDRQWSVHAVVDNLLNTDYVPGYYGTGMAYQAPTRSAMVGVRYDFGTFS